MTDTINESVFIKPFVKWAGGKSSIKKVLYSQLPDDFGNQNNVTYIEPFVGSGAMLFYMLQTHKNIKHAIINDINKDLIHCYRLIKEAPQLLIKLLKPIEKKYCSFDELGQKDYYYATRNKYNSNQLDENQRAALFLFLNHTCFNGLYRENLEGGFNVPFGCYKKPRICNTEVIMADHDILSKVEILCGDYKDVICHIKKGYTFLYLDPPYRPLQGSNNFQKYSKSAFGDSEQEELKAFCDELNEHHCQFMLSNSDSTDFDGSSYFEKLYRGYNIKRILAPRLINAYADKRLKQTEVLISNYE